RSRLRRLDQQKARHRIALLTDGSKSLPTSAATLPGIQPEIAHYLLAPPEALHWPYRQHEHQGCHRTHARLFHQAAGGWVSLGFFGYRSIQLRQARIQSVEYLQQFLPAATRPGI